MPQLIPFEICDAGIDWFTFTVYDKWPQLAATKELFDRHIRQAVEDRNKVSVQKRAFFEGVGTSNLFVGQRGDKWLFDASSSIADEIAGEVIRYGEEINVTRADAKTDVRKTPHTPAISSRLQRYVCKPESRNGRRTQSHKAIYSNGNSGDSCVIGSPKSSHRLSIYNKSAEANLVNDPYRERFEVRLRDDEAKAFWNACLSSRDIPGTSLARVVQECKTHGIYESWMGNPSPIRKEPIRRKSDAEKLLQWFETVVAPAVTKARDLKVSEAEICTVLGIDVFADVC